MAVVINFDAKRGKGWCQRCEAVSPMQDWWKNAVSVFQVQCPKCGADWDNFWPIMSQRNVRRKQGL